MEESDRLTMTRNERIRLDVLTRLQLGAITAEAAASGLRVSPRQLYRLQARLRAEGAAGLVHASRGRVAANRIPDDLRERVVRLAREQYLGLNTSHLHDLLAEREGIVLSRASLRRILTEHGVLASRRPRRRNRHRLRRDRMPQEGILLQVDGSSHHWFGKEHPRVTLLAAIDDATSKVVAAVFREQEDAQGYLLLLEQIVRSAGCPLELYHDRHGIFEQNAPRPWTLEEEFRGRQDPTEVTRALEDLGILSIAAHSPQAKGRIERLWGTWQDRLVAELRLAAITDIASANAFLPAYIERHNARFSEPAAEPGLAYRPVPAGVDLDRVLSFHLERRVAPDNTVRFENRFLQLPPGPWGRSYAGAKVAVHLHIDGRVSVWHAGQRLLSTGRPARLPTLRAPRRRTLKDQRLFIPPAPEQVTLPAPAPPARRTTPKPAPNHPWRRGLPGSPRSPLTDSLTS